jgi:hypothetical protein
MLCPTRLAARHKLTDVGLLRHPFTPATAPNRITPTPLSLPVKTSSPETHRVSQFLTFPQPSCIVSADNATINWSPPVSKLSNSLFPQYPLSMVHLSNLTVFFSGGRFRRSPRRRLLCRVGHHGQPPWDLPTLSTPTLSCNRAPRSSKAASKSTLPPPPPWNIATPPPLHHHTPRVPGR